MGTGTGNACDLKRKKAFEDKIKDYKSKKSIIQAALSNVDKPVNNKIIFDPEDDRNRQNSQPSRSLESRKQLLSDNDEDEEDISFNVKEQFEGKRGEKLFKLQQNITDKRFTLDERFVEDEDEYNENELDPENEDFIGIENEKVKEMEILSEIIGKKVNVRADKIKHNTPMKRMIRYDPENEDNTVQETETTHKPQEKKKKKRKLEVEETTNDTNKEPEVSKEVYYEVKTDHLKNAFQENSSSFKLLDLLGDPDEDEPENDEPINGFYETPEATLNNKSSNKLPNPFKYDSSDEEPEPKQKENESKTPAGLPVPVVKNVLKRDPFFFKEDDYRLQEGYDFMMRMGSSKAGNFSEVRRNLKRIVKSKVKNNERKSAPSKKHGTFARKKRMKVRKALKK